MASQKPPQVDHEAVTELFRSLPFDQQVACIKELQNIMEEGANARKAELLAELAQLDALTGRPSDAAPNHASARGRSRGTAPAKYQSKKDTLLVWSGRGSTPRWLTEEMAESKQPKDSFLIEPAS